jgi:AMMECR1 domain-containing protein
MEHHFTRQQFLNEVCRKAGLRPEAWRDPEAVLLGFTCEVYRESPQAG